MAYFVQRMTPITLVLTTLSMKSSSMSRMRGHGSLSPAGEVRDDGGVVHQDVDPPVPGVDLLHERLHVVIDAHVGRHGEHLAPGGGNLPCHRLHRRNVGDGKPGAGGGERAGHEAADARRSTRNDDDLARYGHFTPPLFLPLAPERGRPVARRAYAFRRLSVCLSILSSTVMPKSLSPSWRSTTATTPGSGIISSA